MTRREHIKILAEITGYAESSFKGNSRVQILHDDALKAMRKAVRVDRRKTLLQRLNPFK